MDIVTSIDASLDQVLAHLPEVRSRLADNNTAAWAATDPVLLELCRLRLAALLQCPDEQQERTPAAVAAGLSEDQVGALSQWPSSPLFDAKQRACLAFAEQFVIDVASLDDVTANAVAEHLGHDGLANFVNALLVVEQRLRLRLVWEYVL